MKAASALVAVLLSVALAALAALLACLTGLDRTQLEIGCLSYIVFRLVLDGEGEP